MTELNRALAKVTDELEGVKAQMDERGSSMTDAAPLVRIKQAVTRLHADMAQMDLRMGVVRRPGFYNFRNFVRFLQK